MLERRDASDRPNRVSAFQILTIPLVRSSPSRDFYRWRANKALLRKTTHSDYTLSRRAPDTAIDILETVCSGSPRLVANWEQ